MPASPLKGKPLSEKSDIGAPVLRVRLKKDAERAAVSRVFKYRAIACRLRERAVTSLDPETAAQLLDLASRYERLAAMAEELADKHLPLALPGEPDELDLPPEPEAT